MAGCGTEAVTQTGARATVEKGCRLPRPSETAAVVFSSTVPTGALSTVRLGSQDITTYVADVRVEKGSGPFYGVLVSPRPVIWNVEAKGDDLDRLVIIGPAKHNSLKAGVRGVVANKVTFVPLDACQIKEGIIYRSEKDKVRRFLEGRLGRPPDHIVGQDRRAKTIVLGRSASRDADGASLGAWTESYSEEARRRAHQAPNPKDPIADQLKSEILRFYPGGIRELAPAEVLSPVKVTRYRILPNQAGLLQLLEDGAIRETSLDEARAWQDSASKPYQFRLSPDFRYRPRKWPPRFVVTRQIQLPPVMGGAHSSSFLIPVGVPEPRGDRGHNCFFYMEGSRVGPETCAGVEPKARLAALALPPDHAKTCRALDVGDDVHIAALSVHGAEKQSSSSRRGRKEEVDVLVKRRGRVLLVVSGHRSVAWTVRPAQGADIVGVLAIGLERPQEVTGLPKNVPIRHFLKDEVEDGRLCSPGAGLVVAYKGGPFAQALNVYVQRLTGREIDWIDGAAAADEFVVP